MYSSIMDFIVIAVVNSLCRYAATYLRMILSATFGAMGAVIVCLVPQEYKFAANIVTYICIGMGMVRICAGNVAFAELIKGFFALYAAAFMLGGVMHVLYYYTYAGYIIRQVIVRDRELMVCFKGEKDLYKRVCGYGKCFTGSAVSQTGVYRAERQLFGSSS